MINKIHDEFENEVCGILESKGYYVGSLEYFKYFDGLSIEVRNSHTPYWEILKHRRDRIAVKENHSFGFDIKTSQWDKAQFPIDLISILANSESEFLNIPFYYFCLMGNGNKFILSYQETITNIDKIYIHSDKYSSKFIDWLSKIPMLIKHDPCYTDGAHKGSRDPFAVINIPPWFEYDYKTLME